MKRILVFFAVLMTACVFEAKAQYIPDDMMMAGMGMPAGVEYADTGETDLLAAAQDSIATNTVVNISLKEMQNLVKAEEIGRQELVFGGILSAAGVAMTMVPYEIYKYTGKGEIIEKPLCVTGHAFMAVGLIYEIVGYTGWFKTSKKFKNISVEFTPLELALNF